MDLHFFCILIFGGPFFNCIFVYIFSPKYLFTVSQKEAQPDHTTPRVARPAAAQIKALLIRRPANMHSAGSREVGTKLSSHTRPFMGKSGFQLMPLSSSQSCAKRVDRMNSCENPPFRICLGKMSVAQPLQECELQSAMPLQNFDDDEGLHVLDLAKD